MNTKCKVRRCFISYSHEDTKFVDKLTNALISRFRIWVDRRSMQPGIPLPAQLAAAVGSVNYLLPVISRASTKSSWVRDEVSQARIENITIIPIRIDHAPVPPEIKNRLYIDFRKQSFPAALKILLKVLDRDLLVGGKVNLQRLEFWGDAKVKFRDPFTSVVSTKPKRFASCGFTLDEPLFVFGKKTINVHTLNSAASDFSGYSKRHPKMLKIELDGKPIMPRESSRRSGDDSFYVKPGDGQVTFSIPARMRQTGHLSKFGLVIGKARLRNFELMIILS